MSESVYEILLDMKFGSCCFNLHIKMETMQKIKHLHGENRKRFTDWWQIKEKKNPKTKPNIK